MLATSKDCTIHAGDTLVILHNLTHSSHSDYNECRNLHNMSRCDSSLSLFPISESCFVEEVKPATLKHGDQQLEAYD